MKLIVGLGNPGKDYERTKHNVGFWCIDRLQEQFHSDRSYKKWSGLVAKVQIGVETVYLLKPQTYMNLSGESVREAVNYLKIEPDKDLILIYDDMDLQAGTIRLREKGSAGGHNGVKSVLQHLGMDRFMRIRIGIGRPPFDIAVVDYVLTPFLKKDREIVADSVLRAADAASSACVDPYAIVMNQFNSSPSSP